MSRRIAILGCGLLAAVVFAAAVPKPAEAQTESGFIPVWRPALAVARLPPGPPAADEMRFAMPVAQLPAAAEVSGPRFASVPVGQTLPAPPDRPPAQTELSAWWQAPLAAPLTHDAPALSINVDSAVMGTLLHSPQVRVLSDTPLIRQTTIIDEQSKFDFRAFMESRFTNTDDPVGSTLTTGGPDRFIDQNTIYSTGVRRTTESGATVEMSQKLGYEDNNSIFFVPNQQMTARLGVNVTQPLLQGAGCDYNLHKVVLAQIDTHVAQDQFSKDLQELLVRVYRAYWDLYLQRATLLQKQRLLQEATGILAELTARRNVDVLESQIVRAKAAAATREAAVIRAETDVRNAESRLRALINDPALSAERPPELIPIQAPDHELEKVDLGRSLVVALQRRPEINEAFKELRAGNVQVQASVNEMLPVFNVVLGTYVSGLEGQSDLSQAFADQFSVGRPTYWGGLEFEMPIGNRGPIARNQQRQLELRRLGSHLEAVTTDIRAEVEIAVREVDTTYREMYSRWQAMAADEAEIHSITERWRLLPGDQQFAGVVLDDLLAAQERLTKAEAEFAGAQVAYSMARIDLKKAVGTLLDDEPLDRAPCVAASLPACNRAPALSQPEVVMPKREGEPAGQ